MLPQDDGVSMCDMSPLLKFTSGRVLQSSRLGSLTVPVIVIEHTATAVVTFFLV